MSVEHKKCPHCGAEIEENARFCLYCMTSLDEKERVVTRLYLRKRWLILSAAFFALLLIGGVLLWVLGKSEPEESKEPSDLLPEQQVSQQVPSGNEQAGEQGGADVSPQQGEHPSSSENGLGSSEVPSGGGSEQSPSLNQMQGGSSQSQSGSSQTQGGSSQPQSGSSQTQSGSSQPQSGSSQTQGGSSQTQSGSSQTQGGSSQTQSGSSQTQSGSSQTQGGSSQTQGGSSQTQSGSSQTPTEQNPSEESAPEQSQPNDNPTQQEPEPTAPIFTYRQMKYGDDYYTNAAVTEDKIVLTGIQTPAADGIYHIPATIDGKTVIAIEGQAFYNSGHALTVKKIYIPSTLKTIWGSAFVGCYNLTDVYLYGKSIYIDSWAFPSVDKRTGTLKIHCSADCNNRDFRYYKNIASSYYDAEYVEWNG
ncbi:MAG: zinc-ribbon domain-containing protein [Clostridia bacterium]|nr:zinc-ribbon domain-containing protein [Clostridia bacterium]